MEEEHTPENVVPPTRNGYVYVGRDLRHRTLSPISQVTFVVNFIASVIVFGGFGIWLELGKWFSDGQGRSSDALLSAFTTFIPALVVGSSLQVFLEHTANPMRILSIAWILLWNFVVVWLTFFSSGSRTLAFVVAILGFFAASWTWWIANATNKAFMDKLDINAPVGGSTDQVLGGDLAGFKH